MRNDRQQVAEAVHALSGQWLDDATCDRLLAQAQSREELLAHGVIDLGWLRGNPQVFARFQAIAANAAVSPGPAAHAGAGPLSPAPTMAPEDARRVLGQFAEEPTACHPFDRLRRMAVELAGPGL